MGIHNDTCHRGRPQHGIHALSGTRRDKALLPNVGRLQQNWRATFFNTSIHHSDHPQLVWPSWLIKSPDALALLNSIVEVVVDASTACDNADRLPDDGNESGKVNGWMT